MKALFFLFSLTFSLSCFAVYGVGGEANKPNIPEEVEQEQDKAPVFRKGGAIITDEPIYNAIAIHSNLVEQVKANAKACKVKLKKGSEYTYADLYNRLIIMSAQKRKCKVCESQDGVMQTKSLNPRQYCLLTKEYNVTNLLDEFSKNERIVSIGKLYKIEEKQSEVIKDYFQNISKEIQEANEKNE